MSGARRATLAIGMLTIELVVPATASALPFTVAYRAAARTVARSSSSRVGLDD